MIRHRLTLKIATLHRAILSGGYSPAFEFDRVLDQVEQRCRNGSSRQLARSIHPIEHKEVLLASLRQVEEFRHTLAHQGYFPDLYFDDFISEAQLLGKAGSVLSEAQFSRIRSASITVNSLLRF